MTQVAPYLTQIAQNLATGDATEHTHRPALANLLESLIPAATADVQAINEPRRIDCGAPDLAVLRDGLLVGHVEAKDVGTMLDVAELNTRNHWLIEINQRKKTCYNESNRRMGPGQSPNQSA